MFTLAVFLPFMSGHSRGNPRQPWVASVYTRIPLRRQCSTTYSDSLRLSCCKEMYLKLNRMFLVLYLKPMSRNQLVIEYNISVLDSHVRKCTCNRIKYTCTRYICKEMYIHIPVIEFNVLHFSLTRLGRKKKRRYSVVANYSLIKWKAFL